MGGTESWRSRLEDKYFVTSVPQSPYPMPLSIWQALYSRGLKTAEEINNFLSPKLKELKDPFEMKDMHLAVERILKSFLNGEKIAIYADFDLDGTSGLALLYEGLKNLGFKNIIYYQPKRLSEGYGLHASAVEDLANLGTKLVISVDVGITAFEAAERTLAMGLDLIITDHHLPEPTLPNAFAVVNPNRKDCRSGLGYLCGAGVAFFLLLAIKSEMAKQGLLKNDFNLKELLDYFIIGTLTDMVPLINDNRVLIKHGLIKISQTSRPGLKFLMQELGMWGRILTSQEVAIGLAPKLNALSRIESSLLPRDVLLIADEVEAKKMVSEVLRTQELRKRYQTYALEKAFELCEMMEQKKYIWVWSHEFHKGVIGLVATQLVQSFGVPCFVGSINETGKITGSARLPEDSTFDLTQILGAVSKNLEKFGGHAMAAGFQLDMMKADDLDDEFEKYFFENKVEAVQKVLIFDAEGTLNMLTPSFMKWYLSLEPFGKDFPPVLFRFQSVAMNRRQSLKGGHIKFIFKQDFTTTQGILFSPSDNHKNIQEGDIVDVIAHPQWNHYNGSTEIQLIIKDIKASLL